MSKLTRHPVDDRLPVVSNEDRSLVLGSGGEGTHPCSLLVPSRANVFTLFGHSRAELTHDHEERGTR